MSNQEKINKLLYRLDNLERGFCCKVNCCLGISSTGDQNLFLNQQGNWVEVSGGNSWSLDGNSGTNTTDNFLGTTDNVGLRIQSTSDINRINGVSVIGTSTDGGYGVYLQGNGVEGVEVRGVGETGVLLFGNGTNVDVRIQPTNGNLELINLGEADGKVLTSDSTGKATWQNATVPLQYLDEYANDAAAALGGIPINGVYRETGTGYLKARLS